MYVVYCSFLLHATATTEIYTYGHTLSLHDALPIWMRSRNSTTVTLAPSRRHTEPSSSPITPAPTTSRCPGRSEEHTSELQSLMRISYAVFCWKKNKCVRPDSNTTIRNSYTLYPRA